MDLIFVKIIGIGFIIGVIYGIAKRHGFTTFIKGLVGFFALCFFGYCALRVLPKVLEWILPWTGIIIVLVVLFLLSRLIRR